jgi:HEXXH motif-containing protein
VAVNAAAHDGWPRYLRTIVHEAAHLLLFGLARNEPLVNDGPARCHDSPLRRDPRPMDGLFHAAFVLARECFAFDRLLCWHEDTCGLDAGEVATLEGLLEASAVAFWECDRRLREHASMAAMGDAILGECEAFMRSSFIVNA